MLFGAYGQKKNSLIPANPPYLDVFDVIPTPQLAAMKLVTTLLDVEFADANGINLLAGLKIPGLASGQVGVKVSDINGGKVKLLKVGYSRRRTPSNTCCYSLRVCSSSTRRPPTMRSASRYSS